MTEQLSFWPRESTPGPAVADSQVYHKPARKPLTIKELPESERPVSRLHHYGPTALSTTELLAILLGNPHRR